MGFGSYDYDSRYRRRFWSGLLKLLFMVGFVLTASLFSYQMGIEQFQGRDRGLREEVEALSRQKAELELLAGQMNSAARAAESRVAELESRLAREVPSGDRALLLDLVAERLAAGVDPKRLAFVIDKTENPRNCENPENKRFVLATPLMKTGVRGVGFANGTITVTGEGVSARNSSGNPESWFDPALPVNIKITAIGGRESVVSGVLPLHHSEVAENTEYRFTFAPGARSFVDVTADRCPFP